MNAYKGTSVNWAKTQTNIIKMLTSKGIYKIRFTNLEYKFALELLVHLPDQQKPVDIRIIVTTSNNQKREQELNRLHRVLSEFMEELQYKKNLEIWEQKDFKLLN